MTRETEELLTDMRTVYGALYEYRDPARLYTTDADLVLGVLLRMEMEPLRKQVEKLSAEVATLKKRLAPPPPTREQLLGIGKGPEQE